MATPPIPDPGAQAFTPNVIVRVGTRSALDQPADALMERLVPRVEGLKIGLSTDAEADLTDRLLGVEPGGLTIVA